MARSLAFALLGLIGVGCASAATKTDTVETTRSVVADTVEARRFIVRNGSGVVVAELASAPECNQFLPLGEIASNVNTLPGPPMVGLRLNDPYGHPRILVVIRATGLPTIATIGSSGFADAIIGYTQDGHPGLVLYGGPGRHAVFQTWAK